MKSAFYDGTKLLSLQDKNGDRPEIIICESNRSAGKTTYFTRLAFNRFLSGRARKIGFLYRFNYELVNCAEKIFKDVSALFFPDKSLVSKARARGIYHDLYIGDTSKLENWNTDYKLCGYAMSINNADQIKKLSHLFSDIDLLIFDEFQSETGKYSANEVAKFISIHTSIARGRGEQVRFVPVIMISNPVSIVNPYYVELGISTRLTAETKYMRGDGFVLERIWNESAAVQQKGSAFNRAFAGNDYIKYAAESVYLNDNLAFVSSCDGFGFSRYVCTIKYSGKEYAIREFPEAGILYCDQRPDTSYPLKIALTVGDHDVNYIVLKNNEALFSDLKYYFNRGCFRFKNLECKEVVFKIIGIC